MCLFKCNFELQKKNFNLVEKERPVDLREHNVIPIWANEVNPDRQYLANITFFWLDAMNSLIFYKKIDHVDT